jgi:hypothetical protein
VAAFQITAKIFKNDFVGVFDIILVVRGCGYFRPFFLPRLGKSSVVLSNSVMLVTFANGTRIRLPRMYSIA